MPTVLKSVLVDRPAATLFALVDAVERYPEFLPWCKAAKVEERTAESTRARIDVEYHGLATHFTTLNRKRAPRRMDLELVEGPFERFRGQWRFLALGDEGCRVELELDYAFANRALETLLGPVFAHIAETLVERFVARARES